MSRLFRWPVWMAAALLIAAALACSVKYTTAHFENAALFREASGETRTRSFKQDETFYCIVDLKDVGAKPLPVKMEMVRIVTQADGTQQEIVVADRERDTPSTKLIYTLVPPESGRVKGDYQIRLYLDGEKKVTLEFKIK
jgi:hypothetical protein